MFDLALSDFNEQLDSTRLDSLRLVSQVLLRSSGN